MEPFSHVLDFGVSQPQDLSWLSPSASCMSTYGHEWNNATTQPGRDQSQASTLWDHATTCMQNGTKEYCVYSNSDFAGRGISIVTSPARAVDIAKSIAFTDPEIFKTVDDLNAEESPRWRVEEMPGKGMGLVATRNIELGDHIMSTTASIMVDYNLFYDAPPGDILEMQVVAMDLLPDTHRRRILNLSTHDHASDYETQVNKVILTNSFNIDTIEFPSVKDESEDKTLYTVFPEISRMNHDCRPNADYYFDPDTYAQHIHAARPIAAGEEITISYIDPVMKREARLARLSEAWHFPCSCSACTQNKHMAAASDSRVHQIMQIRKELRNWEVSQATPALAELLISLYKQERLSTMMYEAYTYAAMEYNGQGEPWLATKYARLAIQHGLATGGPKHSDVVEMTALAEDPWGHWSWMLRTRKRFNWDAQKN